MLNSIAENWPQFAACFFIALAFFFRGAAANKIPITVRTAGEIATAAAAVVLLFVFLSGGRGCSSQSNMDAECAPPGTGIYNDCP